MSKSIEVCLEDNTLHSDSKKALEDIKAFCVKSFPEDATDIGKDPLYGEWMKHSLHLGDLSRRQVRLVWDYIDGKYEFTDA